VKIFDGKTQSINLPLIFKTLSNQTRLEILISLQDNCSTAGEISKRLNMDISTVYRHLKFLKNKSLITSFMQKGIERYDLASEHVYNLIESAINTLSSIKQTKAVEAEVLKIFSDDIHYLSDISVNKVLDVRGEMCPVPDIQTRKQLEMMEINEILLVIIDYPLSKERIPKVIEDEGHEMLALYEDKLGDTKIYIRRR
jgi:TusA-related sulfurtransferase/DNA-binding MarR family transcriptional regulator